MLGVLVVVVLIPERAETRRGEKKRGGGELTVTLSSTVSTPCGSPIESALQSLVVRSVWCQNVP